MELTLLRHQHSKTNCIILDTWQILGNSTQKQNGTQTMKCCPRCEGVRRRPGCPSSIHAHCLRVGAPATSSEWGCSIHAPSVPPHAGRPSVASSITSWAQSITSHHYLPCLLEGKKPPFHPHPCCRAVIPAPPHRVVASSGCRDPSQS